jgi:flagellar biosynthesis/type III secretory pathway M-ring protein FliF/YscJ
MMITCNTYLFVKRMSFWIVQHVEKYICIVLLILHIYRILQKQRARTQSENMYYNVSMSASHEEQSQSDTDRHPDRNDIELASASRQCETTLYEKLSEQNIGNLYDRKRFNVFCLIWKKKTMIRLKQSDIKTVMITQL